MREKAATFEVKCLEVKSRFIPEWSDDLAQNMGDYESLLDLRIKARESLAESAERDTQSEYADKVIEKVGEGDVGFYVDNGILCFFYGKIDSFAAVNLVGKVSSGLGDLEKIGTSLLNEGPQMVYLSAP